MYLAVLDKTNVVIPTTVTADRPPEICRSFMSGYGGSWNPWEWKYPWQSNNGGYKGDKGNGKGYKGDKGKKYTGNYSGGYTSSPGKGGAPVSGELLSFVRNMAWENDRKAAEEKAAKEKEAMRIAIREEVQ